TVDTTASVLNWKGNKPFVKDYGHAGTVGLVSGELTLDTADQLASGSFVFNMNSIPHPRCDEFLNGVYLKILTFVVL
ncbi:MAG: hypothetical protein RL767_392, partial [Bacteroidota bacterium]